MDSTDERTQVSEEFQLVLNRFMKCGRCDTIFSDSLRQPQLLPCLHNVCSACLNDVTSSKDEIKCPKCELVCKLHETKAYLIEKAGKCKIPGHNDDLNFFCEKDGCCIMICEKCASTEHSADNGHLVFPAADIYKRKQMEIYKEKTKADSAVKHIETTIKDVETELFNIEKKRKTITEDIHYKFKKATHILECRRNKLNDEVEDSLNELSDILKEHNSCLRNQKLTIQDCATFFDYSSLSKNIAAFLQIAPLIKSRFEYLNSQAVSKPFPERLSIEFSPLGLETDFEESSRNLGEIKFSSSDNAEHKQTTLNNHVMTDDYLIKQTSYDISKNLPSPRHNQSSKKTVSVSKDYRNTDLTLTDPTPKDVALTDAFNSWHTDSDEELHDRNTLCLEFNEDWVERRLFKENDQDDSVSQVSVFQPNLGFCQLNDKYLSFDVQESKKESVMNYPYPVYVVKGELAKEVADVLVNSTSPSLSLNFGSVSSSLLKTAGKHLQQECRKVSPRGINYGDFVVTNGYNLKCKKVYHGALPPFKDGGLEMLEKFMMNCLLDAGLSGMFSICFPALGTGNLKYPKDKVAKTMFDVAEKFFKANNVSSCTLKYVKFVVYQKDAEVCEAFEKEEKRKSHFLREDNIPYPTSN